MTVYCELYIEMSIDQTVHELNVCGVCMFII